MCEVVAGAIAAFTSKLVPSWLQLAWMFFCFFLLSYRSEMSFWYNLIVWASVFFRMGLNCNLSYLRHARHFWVQLVRRFWVQLVRRCFADCLSPILSFWHLKYNVIIPCLHFLFLMGCWPQAALHWLDLFMILLVCPTSYMFKMIIWSILYLFLSLWLGTRPCHLAGWDFSVVDSVINLSV